jgi:hypothetical protein
VSSLAVAKLASIASLPCVRLPADQSIGGEGGQFGHRLDEPKAAFIAGNSLRACFNKPATWRILISLAGVTAAPRRK